MCIVFFDDFMYCCVVFCYNDSVVFVFQVMVQFCFDLFVEKMCKFEIYFFGVVVCEFMMFCGEFIMDSEFVYYQLMDMMMNDCKGVYMEYFVMMIDFFV